MEGSLNRTGAFAPFLLIPFRSLPCQYHDQGQMFRIGTCAIRCDKTLHFMGRAIGNFPL